MDIGDWDVGGIEDWYWGLGIGYRGSELGIGNWDWDLGGGFLLGIRIGIGDWGWEFEFGRGYWGLGLWNLVWGLGWD